MGLRASREAPKKTPAGCAGGVWELSLGLYPIRDGASVTTLTTTATTDATPAAGAGAKATGGVGVGHGAGRRAKKRTATMGQPAGKCKGGSADRRVAPGRHHLPVPPSPLGAGESGRLYHSGPRPVFKVALVPFFGLLPKLRRFFPVIAFSAASSGMR